MAEELEVPGLEDEERKRILRNTSLTPDRVSGPMAHEGPTNVAAVGERHLGGMPGRPGINVPTNVGEPAQTETNLAVKPRRIPMSEKIAALGPDPSATPDLHARVKPNLAQNILGYGLSALAGAGGHPEVGGRMRSMYDLPNVQHEQERTRNIEDFQRRHANILAEEGLEQKTELGEEKIKAHGAEQQLALAQKQRELESKETEGQAGRESKETMAKEANETRTRVAEINAQSRERTAEMRARAAKGKVPQVVLKPYQTYQDSVSRMNVMEESAANAFNPDGTANQQEHMNILTNHLGMTLKLAGGRVTQAAFQEAQKSAPWMQRVEAHFDANGYLTGVVLTQDQIKQMTRLAHSRLKQDERALDDAEIMGGFEEPPGARGKTAEKGEANEYQFDKKTGTYVKK